MNPTIKTSNIITLVIRKLRIVEFSGPVTSHAQSHLNSQRISASMFGKGTQGVAKIVSFSFASSDGSHEDQLRVDGHKMSPFS